MLSWIDSIPNSFTENRDSKTLLADPISSVKCSWIPEIPPGNVALSQTKPRRRPYTSFWTHHSLTNQAFDAAEPRLMTAPINKPKPIISTTLQARPSSLIACVVSSASQHVVTISNTVRWTQSIEGSSIWNKRDRQCDFKWSSICCFLLRGKNDTQFHYGRWFLLNVLFSAPTWICIRIICRTKN